jgi:hypothetical protein
MSGPAVSSIYACSSAPVSSSRDEKRSGVLAPSTPGPIREVAEWAGEFKRFWEASYARLDAYLDHLKRQEKHDGHRH